MFKQVVDPGNNEGPLQKHSRLHPSARSRIDFNRASGSMLCPTCSPVEASQILTVLLLALARDLPSGLHVTSLTHAECHVDTHTRVMKFKITTRPSSLHLTSLKPSGLKQKPRTVHECQITVQVGFP